MEILIVSTNIIKTIIKYEVYQNPSAFKLDKL